MGVFSGEKGRFPLCVGIVSDTHGTLDERVWRLLADCDLIVHAGDIGAQAVLERLESCAPVVAVAGNNDVPGKWIGAAGRLAVLAESAMVELPGGTLAVIHGHRHGPPARRHARLREAFPQARLVVYGHSHRLVTDTGTRPWVANPGAAGTRRTGAGPSALLLHVTAAGWRLAPHRFALPAVAAAC